MAKTGAGKAKKAKKATKKVSRKGSGGKKRHAKGFQSYIFRVVKQLHKGQIGISSRGMAILSSFANEMFERISREASNILQASRTTTLGSRQAATAVKLAIPGELGRYASVEAAKALAKYAENQ